MNAPNQVTQTRPVVVAINEGYTDNNGSTSTAVWWNGVAIHNECYADGYNGGSFDDRRVNASHEQIKAAADEYQRTSGDICNRTYIGCVVKLTRARKAPNRTPLEVVDHQAPKYRQNERICVEAPIGRMWVSIGCVESVVSYRAPSWGPTSS